MQITYTQCKQMIDNGQDLREIIERLCDVPEWMLASYYYYSHGFERWDDRYREGYVLPGAVSLYDIQSIIQGGCASGAWMPAVTYWTALEVMRDFGDEVLQYIEDQYGELPDVAGESWAGMAVKYLSCAVELWCAQFDLDGVDWD